jgi:hypothetical protein
MSSIRIIAVPPGPAPEVIREAWVGVKIPLATEEDLEKFPLSGARWGSENVDGHMVLSSLAVTALRTGGNIEAVEFWEDLIENNPYMKFFQFRKEVCEVLEK